MLDQTRQAGAGDVNGRTGTLWLGTVFAKTFAVAIRIHVPVLPVLAIVVHGEECSVFGGRKNVLRTNASNLRAAPETQTCPVRHLARRKVWEIQKGRRPDIGRF